MVVCVPFVIGLIHKTLEGAESTVGDKLEVAELTLITKNESNSRGRSVVGCDRLTSVRTISDKVLDSASRLSRMCSSRAIRS